jgi:hypothetical protein
VRHATCRAIWYLRWEDFKERDVYAGLKACTWKDFHWGEWHNEGQFTMRDAIALRAGRHVTLPTCPSCAVLVDVAITDFPLPEAPTEGAP